MNSGIKIKDTFEATLIVSQKVAGVIKAPCRFIMGKALVMTVKAKVSSEWTKNRNTSS